ARYSDTYANKPSTSSAGTSSQMQDIQKMRAASAMRQGGVSLPGANNPTSVDITNSQNRQRTAPSSPAPTSSTAPTTPAKPTKDFNRATGSSKPGSRLESYDFASPNQVALDMQHLYQSIYEGKKVDQDQDGDNDGADVMIARMIASGMSREEAIRRTRKKSYNKESYDLEQLAILYLVQEGYAEDLRSAQAIYENASLEFKKNLQEIAPALVAGAARVASVTRAAAPVMSKLAKSKNLRNVASNLLSKQEQSTPSTGENASKENPTLDKIRDLLKTVRGEE
ncbi:MAG: hypothetical protein EBR67_07680, partial [Proteobacteria bacterium]|nr:hypothetical protein [Pseudomonadota bacterium]